MENFYVIMSLMKPSILQTADWENFQKSLGETTFFEKTADYQFLAIKKPTPLGTYLYLPYGPYIRQKNASKAAYEAVLALAEREDAFFIRIEPQSAENASHWLKQPIAKKSHDLSPAHTLVLDLTPDKDAIIAGMKQNNRNLFRNYAKKGLKVRTSRDKNDLKTLVKLQKPVASRQHIIPPDYDYLEKLLDQPYTKLYLVDYTPVSTPADSSSTDTPTSSTPKTIAASLIADYAGTRYYLQAAADDNLRKLSAGTVLVAQMIADAKDAGLKAFDFWGISPEGASPNHPWYGFTKFKKSFGGTPVEYAGTYDLVLKPAKYRAYQLLRKANRVRRRIHH